MNIFEHYFKSIRGAPLAMSKFQGQPVLVVNTASECGFTPQYQKLQRLWMEYRGGGLVVLGIPSNDFGEQEPGSDDEIDEFCYSNYGVTFPMTSKQNLLGVEAHALFKSMRDEFGEDAIPKWNFCKYFFDRYGQMVEYWPSKIEPDDPLITHHIEVNLQSWVL